MKTFVVAICNAEADLKVELTRAEDWKAAVLAHEFNPFVTDPEDEGENSEPDPDMIPESYDETVQEAFNMDADLAVHELRVDTDLSIKMMDVE
jgi:hypothetical protein